MGWLGAAYLWVKAGHIIFVIFWMAGLFMLPRFFIYHQDSEPGSDEWTRWIERERRLIRIILNPALVVAWALGLGLAWHSGVSHDGWFLLKLLFVLGLALWHVWMVRYAQRLAKGGDLLPGRRLRLLNEIPGVAAVFIVSLAVVRPF